MAEFKISRFRYTWRNVWTTSTAYIIDDVIRFGGSSWVCVRNHTASEFAADQLYYANQNDTDPTPAWIKMTDGFNWTGAYSGGTYGPGDVTLYGGNLYLCLVSTDTTPDDTTNWTLYAAGESWTGNWTPSTSYAVNDLVKYNGIVYRCIISHTSADTDIGIELGNNDGDDDSSGELWAVYHEGVEYRAEWADATRYRLNDLVKFGGTLLRCTAGHISDTAIDSTKFTTEFSGFGFYGEWSADAYYAVGDIVRQGGYIYRSLTNNTNSSPGDSQYEIFNENPLATADWTIVSKGTNIRGDWSATETYNAGDLVRRGGRLYVAVLDTSSDGSSLDYLDAGAWEVVVPSQAWRNFWELGSTYAVGDIVTFAGTTWSCNFEHVASGENWPSLDSGSGKFYWDIVLLAGANSGLEQRGDLLTFNLSRTLAGDGSSLNETAVTIGEAGQLLTVDNQDSVIWDNTDSVARVYYVNADIGIDDENDLDAGKNPIKPFRTIRFACEAIEAENLTNEFTIVKVATGTYEEVLPIIIPVNVSIFGDDKRSVLIKPKPAIPALAGDSAYTIAALNRVAGFIPAMMIGNAITKSPSNPLSQTISSVTEIVALPFNPPIYDQVTGEEVFREPTEVTTTILSNAATGILLQEKIIDILQYINFYVDGVGSAPVLSGTNTVSTATAIVNAVTILQANKAFLAEEAVAFVSSTTEYSFDPEGCKRDMRRYIDAICYDILRTGNYKSLLAARYYRNAVLGSETEDMFYCRNASGVRHATLNGLLGDLDPPQTAEIYRRPTGGAYISLDPGWGPDDDRVWITTRSPYIQDCVTFGYGTVGAKIDGSLHNGGYKSFTANDFTQIISDGIGAYVLNNGRAELVSVFTYYSQIGYFAENGGVIRATNGNNSYGDFGAIADGNDPTETPQYGKINTRSENAVVASAFAGEVNDEILILEFTNAGQDYTTANYTFVGSGTQAAVTQEEFRDTAMFEALLSNVGLNYTLVGNNAQFGDTTSVTIASNDPSTEEQLLGLRVILTSGTGTGQYGYVKAYNPALKKITVYRESDDQPGWDHVIPGYPITPLLVTSTTYKFEPRPIFSHPGFAAEAVTSSVITTWASIGYGETTTSYTAVEGSEGSGTTSGVTPETATWNVTKTGRSYTVELLSGGAGYATGQTVTILGSLLGGEDAENDIDITVTSISNDSTDSILDFTYVGVGRSGVFVALPSTGTSASYSYDGETWQDSPLPTAGNWKSVAAGNNMFVAVRFGSPLAASSLDGINWTSRAMPVSSQWNSVAYGEGIFVAVSGIANNGAISTDGMNWVATTLPTIGDSTINVWVDVVYGNGRWVAIADSNNISAVGTYDSETGIMTWEGSIMDVIDDSSQKEWVSVAYGTGRFVALSSQGDIAYSFDGALWYPGEPMPKPDGSTVMHWNNMSYGQGVFFATCDTGSNPVFGDDTTGPTNYVATSYGGIAWTGYTLATSSVWGAVAFGNPDITIGDSTAGTTSTGMWIAMPTESTNTFNRIFTGARTLGRVIVEGVSVKSIRIWEPGSGYRDGAPTLTIVDPKNTSDATIIARMADKVLAQPTWRNRGVGYKTSTTTVTVTGDGHADILPVGNIILVDGLSRLPTPGAQFRFPYNSKLYTVVRVTREDDSPDGTKTATFQISPYLKVSDNLIDDSEVEIRERYSQCRITGHDFLDVGTGNFLETNYPSLYSTGDYTNAPENELIEQNGGRVFYTSTDQNGNFRTGELFAVEQATGIVTISADFFDLQGLSELSLGGVRLGGSGTVVREFSTDPLFIADSNNVVPTQRAIKAYLTNRLNVGGSDLSTASFIAGTILVGPDRIASSANLSVNFTVGVDLSGQDGDGKQAGISGFLMAQGFFYRSFRDQT